MFNTSIKMFKKIIKVTSVLGAVLLILLPYFSFAQTQASFAQDGMFLIGDYTHYGGTDNWVTEIHDAKPGDLVRFLFTFNNISSVTAVNARGRISVSNGASYVTITGTISADNAPAISATTRIYPAAGYQISLEAQNGDYGGPGDVLPGSQNIEYLTTNLLSVVGNPVTPPNPVPTANLWAEVNGQRVTQVPRGTVVVMNWNSTYATQCIALAGAGFSTNNQTSGSDPVSALDGTTTFSIRCSGTGGDKQANYTVTVTNTPPVGSKPGAITNPATNISKNSATLNGQVNPNGANTNYWFEYGTSWSLGNSSNHQGVGSGNSYINVSYALYSLSSNTTYYFRAVAQNEFGISYGEILNFRTNENVIPPTTPPPSCGSTSALTNPATNIIQNSAVLNGQVGSGYGNCSVTYWFEYGQTNGLGQTTSHLSAGSGSMITVNSQISGLSSNTTYYFRVAAQNSNGTNKGAILSFTTSNGGDNGSAPTVVTNSATGISQNSATLNGQVNPNGGNTNYWFEYGTSWALGYNTSQQNAGSGNSNINVNSYISGLSSNTTYYFRAVAQNNYGIVYGSILSFTTSNGGDNGSAPTVVTNSATNLYQTSVQLNGQVNPNGGNTNYWFEYGQTTGLGQTTSQQNAGSGNSNINVNSYISGLSSNTTYYFRVSAQNPSGTAHGSILSFTTSNGGDNGSVPTVVTNSATNLYQTSAQLNGQVNPNSASTNYWFEYGQTTGLGQTTSQQNAGSSNSNINISSNVSGLNNNATYYFRAVAQNNYGIVYGSILSFTTSNGGDNGSAPVVNTFSATGYSQNYVTLNGQVDPNGSDTYAWFEYGVNTNDLTYTSNSRYIGSETYWRNFSQSVSNLQSGTTYYYRAVARNSYGTAYGSILSFSTSGGNNDGQIPLVVTKTATYVYRTSALLNGEVNPNGGTTNGWFEYGTNPNGLGLRTISQPIGSGNWTQQIISAVSGLTAGTTYYYRAVAQNQYGTGYGSVLSFQTTGNGGGIIYVPTEPRIIVQNTSVSTVSGGTACVILVPALDVSALQPGQEFTYTVTYRNGCNYNLSNVFLKVILPTETEFISTNYPFYNRDANGISYNLGVISQNFQSAISIRGVVSKAVNNGDTLIFSAVANFNDSKGVFQSVSAYLSAIVGVGNSIFGASIFDAFSALMGNWLFILLLIILILWLIWYFFFKRDDEPRVDPLRSDININNK